MPSPPLKTDRPRPISGAMASARPRPLVLILVALAAMLVPVAEANAADRDRDRMRDSWERRYNISTRVANGARDPDRDGLRNLSEYRKRTHPRRADTDRDGVRDGADPYPRTAGVTPPATLRGVGATLPTDAQAAARVRRSSWEPRPQNWAANNRVPTAAELSAYRLAGSGDWGGCDNLRERVTGNFRGTTDEVIQWAAWKWGFDEDVLRGVATNESWWKMSAVGNGGLSYGLAQVRRGAHAGTQPLAAISTAFNLDYFGAYLRYTYEGCAGWMNTVSRGQTYRAGDFWASLRAWCSGRWYLGCDTYTQHIREHVAARTWRRAGF